MKRQLGVSLEHVALLRQAGRGGVPDPVTAAASAEAAGAQRIIVHLRSDRRFIQDRDVRLLRQTVQTSLSIRMPTTQEMLKLAYDIKPDEVTLVPEARDDLTPRIGLLTCLDVNHQRDHIRKFAQALRDADIVVRAFIDPDIDQIRAVHRADIEALLLDTGKFADARGPGAIGAERQRLEDAVRAAHKLGIRVAVGNGINYHNVTGLAGIDEIHEVEAGHSIIARSMACGLDQAVRDMAVLINW